MGVERFTKGYRKVTPEELRAYMLNDMGGYGLVTRVARAFSCTRATAATALDNAGISRNIYRVDPKRGRRRITAEQISAELALDTEHGYGARIARKLGVAITTFRSSAKYYGIPLPVVHQPSKETYPSRFEEKHGVTPSVFNHQKDPRARLLRNARDRAKDRGIEFDLVLTDIVIPNTCPVLGIPIIIYAGDGKVSNTLPTLDRVDNTKGYLWDNIAVVSHRANCLKSDATVEEMVKLASFYSSYQGPVQRNAIGSERPASRIYTKKLSEEQQEEAYRMHRLEGKSFTYIGRHFSVSWQTISRVIKKKQAVTPAVPCALPQTELG